jgi:ferrous-iron efflux pump FieF
MDADCLNRRAAQASVVVAVSLVAIKVWAMLATGALSVAASLADSALDLMMSLGALGAVIYAAKPPDDDHAFGHSSAEDLAALGQALVLGMAALAIGAGALWRLLAGADVAIAAEGAGMGAMAVSILLTAALVVYQGRVARLTGNRVIAADRLHYMTDLLPALGAIVSLAANRLWGLWQVDALVAVLAALFLLRGAGVIGRAAWDALMDRGAEPQVVTRIAALATGWPGVRGWHDLKTRKAGSRLFVHLHIELDGAQSLKQAHDIGAGLKAAILAQFPGADVIIHKDVARDDVARDG